MHSRSLPDLLGIDLGPPTRNTARPQNFPKGNRSRSTESASRQPTETKGRLHPIIRGDNVSIADAGRPHSEERKTAIAQHSTKTSPLLASDPPNGGESGRRTGSNVHTGGLLIEGQRTCVPAGNNGSRCELDGRRSGGTASCGEQLDTVSAAEAALPPDDRTRKATDLRGGRRGGRNPQQFECQPTQPGDALGHDNLLYPGLPRLEPISTGLRELQRADDVSAQRRPKDSEASRPRMHHYHLGRYVPPTQSPRIHHLRPGRLSDYSAVAQLLGEAGITCHEFGVKVAAIRRYEEKLVSSI
jgi:hypothetical protein